MSFTLLVIHTCPHTCKLTLLRSSVSLPSGGPAEGVGGDAEAAGEEDFRSGENEAAAARREEEGCGGSGKTSKPVAHVYTGEPFVEKGQFYVVVTFCLS